MYKLLLCWRYLRTRYIALICIVSVMLGVATMIVVNSVMAGFTAEMQVMMNGMIGDLVFESRSLDGAAGARAHMAKIREVAGDQIAGMSPTLVVPSLMYIDFNGHPFTKQVMLVGIDETSHASVSQFGNYLQHPSNRDQLEFKLRAEGYDAYDHQALDKETAKPREDMKSAGWGYRRSMASLKKQRQRYEELRRQQAEAVAPKLSVDKNARKDPFAMVAAENDEEPAGNDFDPATDVHTGIVLGIGLTGYRAADGSERLIARPGDDVRVSFPTASMPPKIESEFYTVVDIYESKMGDYDSQFVFVPLRALQQSRGMLDPTTGVGRFTTIQIKLQPDADADQVRDAIRNAFPAQLYSVSTWRDKQGTLLSAIQIETAVLNILLFMIIAVAGFGIFAIFLMIVVEKTRDIGILKSLGASSMGIMGIFLSYGLLLGIVGSGVGLVMGLLVEQNINAIADLISRITGQPIFDPSVYYFNEIPTIVHPATVFWVCFGATIIAVLSSIFPAWRASRLHPVRALRYE